MLDPWWWRRRRATAARRGGTARGVFRTSGCRCTWWRRVVLQSQCEPMMDLFRCDETVGRDGDWYMCWVVDVQRLPEKLRSGCPYVRPCRSGDQEVRTFPSTPLLCLLPLIRVGSANS